MIKTTGFNSVALRCKPRRKMSPYQDKSKGARRDSLIIGTRYLSEGATYWFDSKVVRYLSPEYKRRYGYGHRFL